MSAAVAATGSTDGTPTPCTCYASKDLTKLKRKVDDDPKMGEWMSPLEAAQNLAAVLSTSLACTPCGGRETGSARARTVLTRPRSISRIIRATSSSQPSSQPRPFSKLSEDWAPDLDCRRRMLALVWLPLVRRQIEVKWAEKKARAAERRKARQR